MTLVSVVIPTKNRPEAVIDAVRSVFAGSYQQFELFVVDQSLDNASADALSTFAGDPRFHYLRNRRQGVGAASSRNIGIALSCGELVAIIDDDVTVRTDWMENLVAEFGSDPSLQFIPGKLTAPPYDWQQGFIPAFDPEGEKLTNWTMPLHAAGANFSMRRGLFDRIGGYDEFCGPGSRLGASDDGDIAFRIARSGAKWKACSSVEVVHAHGFRPSTDGATLLARYQRGIGGNFGRFMRRGDVVAGLWFLLQALDGMVRVVIPNMVRGRRPTRFGWVRQRFIGFWRGLVLPPGEGFVSGADLRRLRAQLLLEMGEAAPSVPAAG